MSVRAGEAAQLGAVARACAGEEKAHVRIGGRQCDRDQDNKGDKYWFHGGILLWADAPRQLV